MQSDLSALCKAERELVVVPTIPLTAILNGAQSRPAPRSRNRRKGLIVTLVAGLSIAAAAVAAELWSGTHVALDKSGAMTLSMSTADLDYKDNPTQNDIGAAARQAGFPVQLPAGLPEGTRPLKLISDANIVNIAYALPGTWRGSNSVLWISLADPRVLTGSPKSDPRMLRLRLGNNTGRGQVVRWHIGHEVVIIAADGKLASTPTPAELANIKSAMTARSERPSPQ